MSKGSHAQRCDIRNSFNELQFALDDRTKAQKRPHNEVGIDKATNTEGDENRPKGQIATSAGPCAGSCQRKPVTTDAYRTAT